MATATRALFADYAISADTRAFLEAPKRMLIGGEWVDAVKGATLDVFDPATGTVVTTVPAGTGEDVDRAVRAARTALESKEWGGAPPVVRERLLFKLADLIEQHAQEFAEIDSLNVGKSVVFARHVDLGMALAYVRYMAGWATKIEGSTHDVSLPFPDQQFVAYTRKEPVGVVGAIVPWNFPLLMAVWKVVPALATGCTIVLKPAEETPLSALRLAELALEAGIPPGVFNVVTGYGHEAGAALAAHPGINKVAFTGSTEVGKLIGKAAMDNMTRVSLELGGKSPVIVLADADVEQAVQGAANGIFFNQGQVCTAGSRLYVHEKLFDRVVSGVANIAKSLKLGPGLDPSTQLGPLVSAQQQKRVCEYLESGIGDGAQVVTGGRRAERPGYFVEPTVLTGAPPTARVVREEIFGPVLVAAPFRDADDVAALANDTSYGLAASIWSNDLRAVQRLIPKIKAGTVWVNAHNLLDPGLPFGGYKQSGFGREMGRAQIEMYLETKSVLMAV
jgi:phenylacetaldehyde dehydrogenase